jgi:hypothetical protein
MGRRSTKSSPATGAALPFDTVGMTILPGRALPEWAEPAAAAELTGPELIAEAPDNAADGLDAYAAAGPHAASQVPEEWAAATPPAAPPAPAPPAQAAVSPEPAFAMAGAGMVGAPAAPGPGGYGHVGQGYPPEPSRYPAAAAAGLAATAAAASAAPAPGAAQAQSPGYGSTAAPAFEQAWPASVPAARAGQGGPGLATSAHAAPAPTAPAAYSEPLGTGGVATATYASAAATPTFNDSAGAPPAAEQTSQMQVEAPEAPSSGWKAPERPELSPEHVALLSWWADMIANGQVPAPAGTPGAEASAPAKQPRRSFPLRAAALGLVAVAAIGAAAVIGSKVMASDDPVIVPATELTLPATVGGLVPITDPAIGTELQTLLGFGLRPAGVTVTNAYGSAVEGPLALAAMATTMGAPAEAVGQIAAWAERTGATVAPSVPGTAANEGITCAAVEAIPAGQPGSFCVWTASGKRGQTYSVATSVEDAQTLTNEFRTSVTGA